MQMWSQVGKVDKNALGIRVSGLFEGQSYLFRVAAENQCGRGEYVTTVGSVTAKLPFGETLKEWYNLTCISLIHLQSGVTPGITRLKEITNI